MKKSIIFSLLMMLCISAYSQYLTEPSGPIERAVVTIGFLNGGGGLVGADFEYLVTEKIGLQAGIGLVSWGAGLNYHLKSGGARSSFINFGYWYQGFGDYHAQSIFGPSFVFRARRIFQAQIGIGAQLETGPAYTMDETPLVLMYSAGFYIPLK